MAAVRKPVRAGSFYPASASAAKSQIDELLRRDKNPNTGPEPAVGAVAPHAGWAYSGEVALKAIRALLDRSEAHTVVIFGAVHTWGARLPTATSSDYWETPLGTVPVDVELRDVLAGSALPMDVDDHAHAGEHSIEVLLPFVQALSGEVQILPVATPPIPEAAELGRAIGELAAGNPHIVAVASTDLTHYGPDFYGWAPKGVGEEAHRWVKEENDARFVRLMLELKAGAVIEEAQTNRNACGAGAVAAVLAFALAAGATRGVLLDYTTSHEVRPYGEPSDFVGYAGVLFVK